MSLTSNDEEKSSLKQNQMINQPYLKSQSLNKSELGVCPNNQRRNINRYQSEVTSHLENNENTFNTFDINFQQQLRMQRQQPKYKNQLGKTYNSTIKYVDHLIETPKVEQLQKLPVKDGFGEQLKKMYGIQENQSISSLPKSADKFMMMQKGLYLNNRSLNWFKKNFD